MFVTKQRDGVVMYLCKHQKIQNLGVKSNTTQYFYCSEEVAKIQQKIDQAFRYFSPTLVLNFTLITYSGIYSYDRREKLLQTTRN